MSDKRKTFRIGLKDEDLKQIADEFEGDFNDEAAPADDAGRQVPGRKLRSRSGKASSGSGSRAPFSLPVLYAICAAAVVLLILTRFTQTDEPDFTYRGGDGRVESVDLRLGFSTPSGILPEAADAAGYTRLIFQADVPVLLMGSANPDGWLHILLQDRQGKKAWLNMPVAEGPSAPLKLETADDPVFLQPGPAGNTGSMVVIFTASKLDEPGRHSLGRYLQPPEDPSAKQPFPWIRWYRFRTR